MYAHEPIFSRRRSVNSIRSHHLSGLGSSDAKLELCILGPVAEKKWELVKKTVVGISECLESGGARVAVEATLE